jgi:predicted GNAT family acetyltransferase
MSTIQHLADITHNEERHRFEFRDGAYLATLHYERDGDHVTFTHTYVPDAMRGRGAATKLSRGALNEARQRNWKVAARCPFVAVFLERNREFADLVESPAQPTDVPPRSHV